MSKSTTAQNSDPEKKGQLLTAPIPSRGRWWILLGLWMLYASFGLVAVSVAPLIGPIVIELGLSHAAMGSIMGAWQLVYIFSAIPCGVLLDKIGGRKALLVGVLFIAASVLGRSLAVDYWTLLLAVMLFGLGGPIISSGAPKLVAELFSGSERGMAMGIYMTGPSLGGVIALTATNAWLMPLFLMDWRKVMLVWAGFCVIAGVVWWAIAQKYLLDSKNTPADDIATVSRISVMRELISYPAVRTVLLMSVGVFLFNHGLNNWLVELLAHGGMNASSAGYWAALPTVVGIFGSLLIPRLATPNRRFHILFGLCIAALVASFLLQFSETVPLTVGLVLQGIARSSMMTVLVLTLVELPGIGDKNAGTASGMFFSAAELGGVIGPLSIGIIYDATGQFTTALTGLSVIAFALALATVFLASLTKKSPG